MEGPIFAVELEWQKSSESGSNVSALFTGKDAQARAEKYADAEAKQLAAPASEGGWTTYGFNVYRITGADDYDGDLDSCDWDVDVHVFEIDACNINPKEPEPCVP